MDLLVKSTTENDYLPYQIRNANVHDRNVVSVDIQSPNSGQPGAQAFIDWIFVTSEFPVYKEIVAETVLSLLDKIDFLGYQLSYHSGHMTDSEYQEIENKYLLLPKEYETKALSEKIVYLLRITGMNFDAEAISLLFRCDIETANKALAFLVDSLELHA